MALTDLLSADILGSFFILSCLKKIVFRAGALRDRTAQISREVM
jgi:hypothetical protein